MNSASQTVINSSSSVVVEQPLPVEEEKKPQNIFTKTANGATAVSDLGLASDPYIAAISAFNMRLTGLSTTDVVEQARNIIELAKGTADELDKMTFLASHVPHIRCFRKSDGAGNGRRDQSRALFLTLCSEFPEDEFIKIMLKSLAECGYYKDWIQLLKILHPEFEPEKEKKEENVADKSAGKKKSKKKVKVELKVAYPCLLLADGNLNKALIDQIGRCIMELIKTEWALCRKNYKTGQISNLPKWMPLMKPNKIRLPLFIAMCLYPDVKQSAEKGSMFDKWRALLLLYRKHLSELRKAVPFVEKYMQKGKFETINPKAITSFNRIRLEHAFENKMPKGKQWQKKYKGTEGKRCDDLDRIACAEKFKKYTEDKTKELAEKNQKKLDLLRQAQEAGSQEEKDELAKEIAKLDEESKDDGVNVAAVTPIDIWVEACKGNTVSANLNLTWMSKLREYPELCGQPMVTVVDTSGSMGQAGTSHGQHITPIDMAGALTAFFSANNSLGLRHKFIQFSTQCFPVDMCAKYNKEEPTLQDYIHYIRNHGIVASTNFEGVVDLLATMFKDVVDTEKVWVLFITDCQFNAQISYSNQGKTAGVYLKDRFAAMGKKSPKFVFWNCNASYSAHPATAEEENIIMLSGNNPGMFVRLREIIDNPLDGVAEKAKQQAEIDKQQKEAVINTWNSHVQTVVTNSKVQQLLQQFKTIPHFANHTIDTIEVKKAEK